MPEEYKRRQCFPLRLASSLRSQASNLAHNEGISLNHFISLAVAEKISRMEHDLWVQQQAFITEKMSTRAASRDILLKKTQDKSSRVSPSTQV